MAGRGLLAATASIVGSLGLLYGSFAQAAPSATLKISGVPKKTKPAKTIIIKAKGFAGSFDQVSLYVQKDKCAKTEAAEKTKHSGMSHSYSRSFFNVTPNQNYNGSRAFVVNVGEKHACVYLFQQANPASKDQLRKTKSFTVKH